MKGSREFKGNSLLEDVSDYVAIDLETTGLDPMYDHYRIWRSKGLQRDNY